MTSAVAARTFSRSNCCPPWVIAAAVVVPTFMECRTTIANVALRYIVGGSARHPTDSECVITSYLAANAISCRSGWLAARLGRRNYFLLSITLFTISSALCAMATSLDALILFRIMQGLAGGGLQPSSQAILLDAFPPEKQRSAMSLFGIAALLAPVVGPTLGGWITDNLLLAMDLLSEHPRRHPGAWRLPMPWCDRSALSQAPDGKTKSQPLHFDTLGLIPSGDHDGLLGNPAQQRSGVGLARRSIFPGSGARGGVPRGIRWADRPRAAILSARSSISACFWIGTSAPAASSSFCAFAVLYANTTLLPAMLQSLFGYDATTSGLVLSPRGFFAVMMLVSSGFCWRAGPTPRWLIMGGLFVLGIGSFWLSRMNLSITPWQVVCSGGDYRLACR